MAYGYVVGYVTIDDPESYQEYANRDPAIVAAYGGEYLARGGDFEVLEGSFPGKLAVIIRFPTVQAAKDWYDSAEYSEIRPIRQAVSSASIMIMEGK
jgi:uncharacterized protein (DUF1330 family)